MLLTITYEGQNTQELGYLLHKHPDRVQQFDLSYGKAYVFYPEVSAKRTTAALLLDIDPIDLARGKLGSRDGGLFDYVNDRPYASTSFMRETELARQLFEPLGYQVTTKRTLLDEKFPEWGESPYIDLTICGTVKLCELLNHLYVLIPVFDKQKHYYTSEAEIKKLLDHGEGWLAGHPYKEKIARRYFPARGSYARRAIDILLAGEPEAQENADTLEETLPEENSGETARTPLNTQRMEAVRDAVLKSGAFTVLDLGCGECRLTSLLLGEAQIKKVTACDVSVSVLEKAAKHLHLDRMPPFRKNKLTLMQASLTYLDKRLKGYDCACVIEVIEHIEPSRLNAFERVIFEYASPKTIILTTPNREYNAKYETMQKNTFRHGDHRFEWTREEFSAWTKHICERFGYRCEIRGIGEMDETYGNPTQMGVFTKNGN